MMSRAPVDVVGTGDYQPAERKFGLSRQMLQVCLEYGAVCRAESPRVGYRKAAWAIEDTEQDLALIYRAMRRKGLESIENVGSKLAQVIEALLQQWA
jgi:hypothetical protein